MQNNLTVIALIIFAVIICLTVLRSLAERVKRQAKYRKIPIMTDNEIEFFGRLCRALPDHHVFPQVAMSAVIKPLDSFKENMAAYNAINKKRIDYVIYAKDMTLVTLVELDDKMHDSARDAQRDAMTQSAGISTIRWQSRTKPSEARIAECIRELISGTSIKLVAGSGASAARQDKTAPV